MAIERQYDDLLHARDQSVRYMHDQVQYQHSISRLEHKLASLEGCQQQQDRCEAERRHREAMNSMDCVFKEELLQVYKQKRQGVDTIDRISQQINAMMKALEQEAVREGQFDKREKVMADDENSVRATKKKEERVV
eukprot:gene32122-38848_t